MRRATAAFLRRSLSTARVVYPIRPPDGVQSGRLIDEQLFHKMSHIPPERYAGVLPHLHDEEEAYAMAVGDGRQQAAPSLAREGFELWKWPASIAFDDDDEIISTYYPEMEARVAAATGAEHVVGFHHLRRDAARDNRDSTKGPGGVRSNAGAAVFRSHSDYTPGNALLLVGQLEAAGKLPAGVRESCAAGERAFGIINVWRGLGMTVEREPLAVLDARSVAPCWTQGPHVASGPTVCPAGGPGRCSTLGGPAGGQCGPTSWAGASNTGASTRVRSSSPMRWSRPMEASSTTRRWRTGRRTGGCTSRGSARTRRCAAGPAPRQQQQAPPAIAPPPC